MNVVKNLSKTYVLKSFVIIYIYINNEIHKSNQIFCAIEIMVETFTRR